MVGAESEELVRVEAAEEFFTSLDGPGRGWPSFVALILSILRGTRKVGGFFRFLAREPAPAGALSTEFPPVSMLSSSSDSSNEH